MQKEACKKHGGCYNITDRDDAMQGMGDKGSMGVQFAVQVVVGMPEFFLGLTVCVCCHQLASLAMKENWSESANGAQVPASKVAGG